jgi:hypothetical protein
MSLHFEVAIACDLRPDTSPQVLDTLRYMLREEEYAFDNPPAHRFFEGSGWRSFLGIPDWVPFAGEIGGSLRLAVRHGPDGSGYRHTLSIRSFMLDDQLYDGFEFLEWLAGHSETVGLVGYYREEMDLHPTLVYFKGGKVYLAGVKPPREMHTDEPW